MRLQEIERADENLVINEEQAKTVILIYGLYMSDLSSSVIGRDFKQDEKAHQGWWDGTQEFLHFFFIEFIGEGGQPMFYAILRILSMACS